jgi:hypothetical protein
MAQQLILTGTVANDKSGDTLRTSFTKINANFTELYSMTGTQGLQGTQGAQGRQGITGAQGTEGSQGIQGTEGPQGTQGTEGSQGIQGIEGSQGTQGIEGSQGAQGIQGFKPLLNTLFLAGDYYFQAVDSSYNGPSSVGMEWSSGQVLSVWAPDEGGIVQHILITSYNSADGTLVATITDSSNPGYKTQAGVYVSLSGQTGAQGIQGVQGAQGIEGSQGTQGTEGSQGTQGTEGPQGTQGTEGAQGTQGIQGITGIQGTIGQAGHSASYYNYTASTTPHSGDPTAGKLIWDNASQVDSTQINVSHLTNDDVDIDVFLSLLKSGDNIIIQDENDSNNYQTWQVNGTPTINPNSYVQIPVTKIDSAGDGTTGFADAHPLIIVLTSVGIQGVQGTQGTGGAQGIQGITGIQGALGSQGATGAGTQGTQGTQGRQGIQGSIGSGTQGTQGRQGIQGNIGNDGVQGTQGTQGRQGIQGSIGSGTQGAQGIQGIQGAQGIVGSNLSIQTLTVSGTASLNGLTQIQQVDYPYTTKTNATGTVTHDCSVGQVFYHTSPSANFTVNLTNLGVSSGYITKVELYIVQGNTGRLPNALQVAGSSKTISWYNAVTPTPSSNSVDLVTFTLLLNGTTYTVFGKLERYDTVGGGGGG